MDYAKENPGIVTVGHSGAGGGWHLAIASVSVQNNIEFNYVPFDGAAPTRTALIGGMGELVEVGAQAPKLGGVLSEAHKVVGTETVLGLDALRGCAAQPGRERFAASARIDEALEARFDSESIDGRVGQLGLLTGDGEGDRGGWRRRTAKV